MRSRGICILILAAVGITPWAMAGEPGARPETANHCSSHTVQTDPAAGGRKIFIDEQGRRVTPPPGAEVKGLTKLKPADEAKPKATKNTVPGGGEVLKLDRRHWKGTKATIGADGRVRTECIDGGKAEETAAPVAGCCGKTSTSLTLQPALPGASAQEKE